MTLLIHIISAFLGIIGSYFVAYALYTQKDSVRIGKIVLYCGLIGIITSGIFLFIKEPLLFLASGKFLSNMTIMLFLLIIEIHFVWITHQKGLVVNRILSVFSWSWILIVAFLNPPFGYWYFILAYILLLAIILKSYRVMVKQ